MERLRQQKQIGAPWLAAMIVLAVLLALGILLYVRMSAPLHGAGRRADAGLIGVQFCGNHVMLNLIQQPYGAVSAAGGANARAITHLHLRVSTAWPKPRARV